MQQLPQVHDPNLLVGADHFADAGVYRIADDVAIVQSLDFFSPLVDDAFLYGQIAAANALSDVYAMGAQPRTAMNIVCFPDDELDMSILHDILRGGAERVQAAGAVVVGGHSVRDAEIKYGLAVTGVLDPSRMVTNAGARPGDAIVLTKALGTGFITTAIRENKCPDAACEAACASMIQLNDVPSRTAVEHNAHAATDITGFGLAGHAIEMAEASNVCIEIELSALPILTGAEELASRGFQTRANDATRRYHATRIEETAQLASVRAEFLFDPQTSGGLLVAIAADTADEFVDACQRGGCETVARVGQVATYDQHRLKVL